MILLFFCVFFGFPGEFFFGFSLTGPLLSGSHSLSLSEGRSQEGISGRQLEVGERERRMPRLLVLLCFFFLGERFPAISSHIVPSYLNIFLSEDNVFGGGGDQSTD